jgi:adenylate cyclase
VAGYALFTLAHVWLSPVLAIAAAAALYVSQTVAGFFTERRRALQTQRAFARYVPPEVVARLVEQPELLKLGGELRELTILFCDIADFTALSERVEPAVVVALLTDYFGTMSAVIHRHRGTVDKYIGDGIMAFWGAPLPDTEHALHAVQAAIAMRAEFADLARRWARPEHAPLALRIGLHTGKAIVGNVGSSSRFSYTAVGDAVNLASRLEGENKKHGTTILLSSDTAAALPPSLAVRQVATVTVKGKAAAIAVFTPEAGSAS